MFVRLPFFHNRGGRAAQAKRGPIQRRSVFSLLFCLLFITGWVSPVFAFNAAAEGGGRLALSKLDSSAFPQISFYLELYNADGQAVADLKAAELTVLEDQQAIAPGALTAIPRGLQFTVAINAAPALAAQVNGSEQFGALRQTLQSWAAGKGAEFGDFSLAGNTGLQLIRSRDPQQWTVALDAYRPDLAKEQPGLFALTTALDLAADQAAPDLFKSALLFITPPLDAAGISGLGNQAARAAQLGLPVFVWLVVADPNAPQTTVIPGMTELQSLAQQSGGKLALVSAATAFPNLDEWIEPLRTIYRVEYPSAVRGSGQHTLDVQVERPGLAPVSAAGLNFDLTVLAPNPMFVNPPVRLERSWNEESGQEEPVLDPPEVELQLLVEFPDGFQRGLRGSRLYVNDKLAAENTSAPFDRFRWDLSELSASAGVSLRVEVEDDLGLVGTSSPSTVEVVVPPPPAQGLLAKITPQGMVAMAAVLIAGTVLVMILVSETRHHARKPKTGKARISLLQPNDPVTQPVTIEQEALPARRPRRASSPTPSWPRGAAVAPARLVRLGPDETPQQGNQVPINRPELTFGSDPRQAVIALSDSSVCGLHARLLLTAEGSFVLEDENSVAGTWLNYTPLDEQGAPLRHGDLIHFGRVAFRFELADAPAVSEPAIQAVEEIA